MVRVWPDVRIWDGVTLCMGQASPQPLFLSQNDDFLFLASIVSVVETGKKYYLGCYICPNVHVSENL